MSAKDSRRSMGIRMMAAAGLAAIVLTGCANDSDKTEPQQSGQGSGAVAGAKGDGPQLPSNLPSGQAGGSGQSGGPGGAQVYTGGEAVEPPAEPSLPAESPAEQSASDNPETAGDANESAHLEASPGSAPAEETVVDGETQLENPNSQGEGGETTGTDGAQQENPNTQGEGGAANTRPDQTVPLLDLEKGITSPSGNIVCRTTGGEELGCALREFGYTPPANECPDGEPQEWKWGQLITLKGGAPEFACSGPAPTAPVDGAALPYGNSATDGRFTCLSEESGMACIDLETVTGFRISKSSYDELTPSDIAMIDAG